FLPARAALPGASLTAEFGPRCFRASGPSRSTATPRMLPVRNNTGGHNAPMGHRPSSRRNAPSHRLGAWLQTAFRAAVRRLSYGDARVVGASTVSGANNSLSLRRSIFPFVVLGSSGSWRQRDGSMQGG